ncbi:MAG: carbohydrate ABC transporter permease [Anaerolineales bacterium]|nr:carbohydrate ABC transporter permease [Anaerolineales bacterium]
MNTRTHSIRGLGWRHRDLPSHIFVGLVVLVTFFPLYFMLITSVKSTSQMRHYFLVPVTPVYWNNYVVAFRQLMRYFLNTAIVAGVSVPGIILLSAFTAFVFARFAFPGKAVLFYAIISLLMVPSVLTLVPAFVWIKNLGLLNTYWALIFPYMAGGQVFGIYLLRGYFATIPNELFDSAKVDGANIFQVFARIALPLAKPMLSVIGIVNLLSTWNDYIWPLVTLQENSMRTLTIGLRYFQGQFQTNYGPLFAGYVLGSLPLFILFMVAMRPFMSGLTAGAVKM